MRTGDLRIEIDPGIGRNLVGSGAEGGKAVSVYQSEQTRVDVVLFQVVEERDSIEGERRRRRLSNGNFWKIGAGGDRPEMLAKLGERFSQRSLKRVVGMRGGGQHAVGGFGNGTGGDAYPLVEFAESSRNVDKIGRAERIVDAAPVPRLCVSSGFRFPLQQHEVAVVEQGRHRKPGNAAAHTTTSTCLSGVGNCRFHLPSRMACMGAKLSPVHSTSSKLSSFPIEKAERGSKSDAPAAASRVMVWRRVNIGQFLGLRLDHPIRNCAP